MPYNKKTWISNEVITKEALNNIEDGIADLDVIIKNLIGSISLGIHTDGAVYIFIDDQPVGTGIFAHGDYFGDTEGYVDADNNMILADNLDNGTYTLKYENEDGTYTTIGNFTISEESE